MAAGSAVHGHSFAPGPDAAHRNRGTNAPSSLHQDVPGSAHSVPFQADPAIPVVVDTGAGTLPRDKRCRPESGMDLDPILLECVMPAAPVPKCAEKHGQR